MSKQQQMGHVRSARLPWMSVVIDLLEGQYKNPSRVVSFNTAEHWSQDVSADVAQELRRRCDLQQRDVSSFLQDFVDRYEGRYHDVQLARRIIPSAARRRRAHRGDRDHGAVPHRRWW